MLRRAWYVLDFPMITSAAWINEHVILEHEFVLNQHLHTRTQIHADGILEHECALNQYLHTRTQIHADVGVYMICFRFPLSLQVRW